MTPQQERDDCTPTGAKKVASDEAEVTDQLGPNSGGAYIQADQPWGDAVLAPLYDAFPFSADIPLYKSLAAAQGGNVVEIACGSGRVVIPLAEAGNRVTGVDASPYMSWSGHSGTPSALKRSICWNVRDSRLRKCAGDIDRSRSHRSHHSCSFWHGDPEPTT